MEDLAAGDLVAAVRRGLAARGDPDAAPAMQRYMKSAMPFRGVTKPAREQLVRELVAARPVPSPAEFDAAVRELWDEAGYREERYVAHARVDPGWVRKFVDGHPGLSPLSRKEALKHLGTSRHLG
jgi:3-methyladenine DNA glycosylase AlkD